MQFMMKCEVNFEIGGDRAPVMCDVRLGAAFDDQPTAGFLGSSEPFLCGIESDRTGTEYKGLPESRHGKRRLF